MARSSNSFEQRPWSAEEDERLADLKSQGLSMAKIAKRLPGKTVKDVQSRLKTLGDSHEKNENQENLSVKGDDTTLNSSQLLQTPETSMIQDAEGMQNPVGVKKKKVHTDYILNGQPVLAALAKAKHPAVPSSKQSNKRKHVSVEQDQSAPPKGGTRMFDLDMTSVSAYHKSGHSSATSNESNASDTSKSGSPVSAPVATTEATTEVTTEAAQTWKPKPGLKLTKWTSAEDAFLLNLKAKGFSYPQIAQQMSHRTLSAVENRAFRLDPERTGTDAGPRPGTANSADAKDNAFTPEEDTKILDLHAKNWTFAAIANRMRGRTSDEIRQRIPELLKSRPDNSDDAEAEDAHVPKKPKLWTQEDDDLLIELKHKNLNWKQIAKSFPGRSEKAVVQHWTYLRDAGKINNAGQEESEVDDSIVSSRSRGRKSATASELSRIEGDESISQILPSPTALAHEAALGNPQAAAQLANWNAINKSMNGTNGSLVNPNSGLPRGTDRRGFFINTTGPPAQAAPQPYHQSYSLLRHEEKEEIVLMKKQGYTWAAIKAKFPTWTINSMQQMYYKHPNKKTTDGPQELKLQANIAMLNQITPMDKEREAWACFASMRKEESIPGFFTPEIYEEFYKDGPDPEAPYGLKSLKSDEEAWEDPMQPVPMQAVQTAM